MHAITAAMFGVGITLMAQLNFSVGKLAPRLDEAAGTNVTDECIEELLAIREQVLTEFAKSSQYYRHLLSDVKQTYGKIVEFIMKTRRRDHYLPAPLRIAELISIFSMVSNEAVNFINSHQDGFMESIEELDQFYGKFNDELEDLYKKQCIRELAEYLKNLIFGPFTNATTRMATPSPIDAVLRSRRSLKWHLPFLSGGGYYNNSYANNSERGLQRFFQNEMNVSSSIWSLLWNWIVSWFF